MDEKVKDTKDSVVKNEPVKTDQEKVKEDSVKKPSQHSAGDQQKKRDFSSQSKRNIASKKKTDPIVEKVSGGKRSIQEPPKKEGVQAGGAANASNKSTRSNRRFGDERRRGGTRGKEGDELFEKLVFINRVAKVVKGGRRFGFAALVVVGDRKGKVSIGSGKAKEVPEAIRKAGERAKKTMFRVPLREGRTLHHDIKADYGSGKVIIRSAPPGTGIIAGGPIRAVFEALGVQDIVAKSLGTSNPYNMVKAAISALRNAQSPKIVAMKRGKEIGDIVNRRGEVKAKA